MSENVYLYGLLVFLDNLDNFFKCRNMFKCEFEFVFSVSAFVHKSFVLL